jgi:hypothetical protein
MVVDTDVMTVTGWVVIVVYWTQVKLIFVVRSKPILQQWHVL